MKKILIGADVVPTAANETCFINGSMEELLGENLFDVIQASDFFVFNLETPLTDQARPIKKSGPHLIAPSATMNGIKALKPSLVTLANNHIMDQGWVGLSTTIALLENAGINFIGAGESLEQAQRIWTFIAGEKKIGIYACAEHEYSIAGVTKPGAVPFDPLVSFDEIAELKKRCDYIIVLYHGGIEQYRYPSPGIRQIFRKFAEKGANLVIAQHTHCIGCFEQFLDATLVYGQGNFIFNRLDNEYWASGLLLSLNLDEEKAEVEFLPLIKHDLGVRLAEGENRDIILGNFFERSEKIQNDEFVRRSYEEYAKTRFNDYMSMAHGGRLIMPLLNRLMKGKIAKNFYRDISLLRLLNIVQCESHNELFRAGLESGIKYR